MKGLLKFLVVLALIAGVILEAGSPLWTRPGVAGAADDAAAAAARELFQSPNNQDTAKADAVSAAAFRGAKLTGFAILPDGSVKVTVYRHASPHGLDHFSQFKSWYNVQATATAMPQPN